jgi:hypothetical protein
MMLKHIIEHVDSITAMDFVTKKKTLHYSAYVQKYVLKIVH